MTSTKKSEEKLKSNDFNYLYHTSELSANLSASIKEKSSKGKEDVASKVTFLLSIAACAIIFNNDPIIR